MSAISRFMANARAILDEKERKALKEQPPFFVRTNWLFAELEDLAFPYEAENFEAMKVARLGGDIAATRRLIELTILNTQAIPAGRQRHERNRLCAWIIEQIEREART